jgi:para-nitrobenzyl esterase
MPESFGNGYQYAPVVDGWVLPRKPLEIVERGEHNHVPLIVATTSNEFSTMVHNYVDRPLVTAGDYQALLVRRFGTALGARLAEHYPASAYPTPLAAYIAMWSDAAFTCGSDWLADAAAAHQREPVYRFVYDHTYETGPLAPLGAGHGLDLYLVFGNTPVRYLELDATDRALAGTIVGYWSRFAERGDPNGGDAPLWRARGEDHDELVVDTTARLRAMARDRCDFWLPILHDHR